MKQPLRVSSLLGILFLLPVLLLAQRPVSVRTDAGRGVKQERQTTAADRPSATTAPAETPRRGRTTARTGATSEAEATCPSDRGNDQTRARRQPTDRPTSPRTRTRTSPRPDRPAPRTTTDRREYEECDCEEGHANARKGKSGNRGRGWAHGHNKKANPNDRARRIPSVPGHGKKAWAKGGMK